MECVWNTLGDRVGYYKTVSVGFPSFLESRCVPTWGQSLPSEGRGHRFESCRVRQGGIPRQRSAPLAYHDGSHPSESERSGDGRAQRGQSCRVRQSRNCWHATQVGRTCRNRPALPPAARRREACAAWIGTCHASGQRTCMESSDLPCRGRRDHTAMLSISRVPPIRAATNRRAGASVIAATGASESASRTSA